MLHLCHKQVSVAPGGRWNKFKTYSTIQRSLEIWAFVFTFLFKWWLNNKKFTYSGIVSFHAFLALGWHALLLFVIVSYLLYKMGLVWESRKKNQMVESKLRRTKVRSELTVCVIFDLSRHDQVECQN